MRKLKKILSFVICFIFVMGNVVLKVNAAETDKEIVYVDGISFEYYVDDSGDLIISSLEDNGKTYLKLDSEGNAESQIFNDGISEEYNLEIQELSEEELYIEVSNEQNEIIDVYDNPEDLLIDEYDGQAAVAIGTGVAIGTLVTVLLKVTATIVVGGLVYYAASTVIDKIKNNSNNRTYYYKAYINNYVTYIAFYSGRITQSQAASRIKSGQNVYIYT